MINRATEFKTEYQIFLNRGEFAESLKNALNEHVIFNYPNLEDGIYFIRPIK